MIWWRRFCNIHFPMHSHRPHICSLVSCSRNCAKTWPRPSPLQVLQKRRDTEIRRTAKPNNFLCLPWCNDVYQKKHTKEPPNSQLANLHMARPRSVWPQILVVRPCAQWCTTHLASFTKLGFFNLIAFLNVLIELKVLNATRAEKDFACVTESPKVFQACNLYVKQPV